MQMKKSDIFDRWTILRMKSRLSDHAMDELCDYNLEVDHLLVEKTDKPNDLFGLVDAVVLVMEANAKIWAKESALRSGLAHDGSDVASLEEIGRLALEIRELNKIRVQAKHLIDEIYGESLDMKVEHASS